jgi:hypothetical protein
VKLLCSILLASVAAYANAATTVQLCAPGTETPAGTGPIAASSYARVSNSPIGALPYCKLISQMNQTAYVSATADGKTFVWMKIAAALAGAPVAPTPILLQRALLTWSPVSVPPGIAASVPITYNVYRGSSATTLAKLAGGISSTTYTDPISSATPVTYAYAVTATCAGCTESADSPVVTVTVAAGSVTCNAPGNVAVTVAPAQ